MPDTGQAGLADAWGALPLELRARLLPASTGWRRLSGCAQLALGLSRRAEGEQRARLAQLSAELFLWALGENPLSGPLAGQILALSAELPLSAAQRHMLAALAAQWRAPQPGDPQSGLAYFERLAARRDTERLAQFLAGQIAKDPAGLFWRDRALGLSLFCGAGETARGLAHAALDGVAALPGLAPAANLLAAQTDFVSGQLPRCADALAALTSQEAETGALYGPGFLPARRGLALLAAGEDAAGLDLLRAALSAAPWQTGLALAAADTASGLRHALAPPPGPTLIMLYTWNKAPDLDATLASLFAGELFGARVAVLDNGSTDATPQVLEAWARKAGERLLRVTLPVNIGAPAARNWLAALPEARACESLVYLDDDVELPPDWLGRLGVAMAEHPQAGVVGCKVADHQAPHLLQNVAGQLMISNDVADDRPDMDFRSLSPNPFRLCDAHLQGPDWGFFDFVGPCDSVTGCCHLLRRAALDAPAAAGGGFSLALAPSQYDDFERDLRMLAGGRHAAYTGHLRVRHKKRSGLASQGGGPGGGQEQDARSSSNAAGNRYKMQTMHPREEIAGFIAAQAQRLEQALARAHAALK